MINTNKFQETILKKFNSEKEFEVAMGWGKGRTKRIISGKAILTVGDVCGAKEILKMDREEAIEVFLPESFKASLARSIESAKKFVTYLEDKLSKCEKVS